MIYKYLPMINRLLSFVIPALVLFSTAGTSHAQWNVEAPMVTPRAQFAATAHDGKIYAIGGYQAVGCGAVGNEISSVEIYDAATNSWSFGAPFPAPSRGLTAAVGNNGLIYGLGGFPFGTFASYNPATNTWTPIASPPIPDWESSAATGCNENIHIFGGIQNLNAHYIYNTQTNTWTAGPPLPIGVMQHSAVSVGSRIYVIGGQTQVGGVPTNAVQIFDVSTNTWSAGAPMLAARNQFGCTVGPDGNIYAIGGTTSHFNLCDPVFSSVQIYDPFANSWSVGSHFLPVAIAENEAVTIGTEIYTLGGHATASALQQAMYSLELCDSESTATSLYYDGNYVDIGGTCENEATNVLIELLGMGQTVNTFSGVGQASWATALSAARVLVMPENEFGDLVGDIDPGAVTEIQNFVAGGGSMIIFGGTAFSGNQAAEILNGFFGFSIANSGITVGGNSVLEADYAEGTQFAEGPATIPNNNGTHFLVSSLPAGSRMIYTDMPGTTVATIPYGNGEITYLGWDWFLCSQNPDMWRLVLQNAYARAAQDFMTISCTDTTMNCHVNLNPPNAQSAVASKFQGSFECGSFELL